ncbi:uncharacterized protein LOC128200431 [Galleria mellonella]|uniref:Uncharacterized protein LOC128200431 n=1 Tax=Galleria mellonella TaxID=7137 RepID=A0ABM3MEF7_GALME|nr:uncharacterized protein LOC128200431 [Galleria mellonella]
MVVTRSQAGLDEERIVFNQRPRSPSAIEQANASESNRPAESQPSPNVVDEYTGRQEMNEGNKNTVSGEDNHVAAASVRITQAVRSTRSRKSNVSAIARMQYEAKQKTVALQRKQLQMEAELIQMKLAADIAALEEGSQDEEDEPAERVEDRVNAWMQDSMIALRGETSRVKAQPPVQENVHARRTKPLEKVTRVEEDHTLRLKERSFTPGGSRDIERLADTLEQMMKRRPPPRQATDLPLFSGAPSEWLQFEAAMKETTEAYHFTPMENLARLRNCLRGEAREAVAPLLSASTHPEQVMNTLKQCFGRPEVIADQMMEELKHLPKLGGSPTELNTFAVKMQNAVVVLKKLRMGYLHNPLMLREVLEKLSPHQRARWYDYAESEAEASDQPEIVLLSEFLIKEANRALKFGFTTALAGKKEASRPPLKFIEMKKKKPVYTICSEDKEEEAGPSNTSEDANNCPTCGKRHSLPKCYKFAKLKNEERWDVVRKANLCFKCISGKHRRFNCRAKRCGVDGCKLSHHQLLHNKEVHKAEKETVSTLTATDEDTDEVVVPEEENIMAVAATANEREIKLKICPVTVSGPKGKLRIFALFDEGSTVTLLDEKAALKIGAKGPMKTLNMRGINTERCETKSQQITLKISGQDSREHDITVRTVPGLKLTGQSVSEELLQLGHLKDLKREELCYAGAKPQLLIGSDNWQLIVSRELRIGKKDQPAGSKTQLGWVIHGSLPRRILKMDAEEVLHVVTTESLDTMVKAHFEIDAIGISQKVNVNEEARRAMNIFDSTVRQREDGHFEVGLPWRNDNTKLPPSYNIALRRLKNLETRLAKSADERRQYDAQVANLLKKGYAEKCDGSEAGSPVAWYLPHFPVRNINKPGKIRMVFDAAAKSHGKCLNDFLLEGPDLFRSLPATLFRFREEAVAVKADIEEMFLRVKIRKEDQPAQMFLWRTDRRAPPTAYKMTSMIFGAASSPFLAHSVRNRNAQNFASSHPEAHVAITEAHYMDDYVDSYKDEREAEKVMHQVDYVHRQAGFQLRSWESNRRKVLRDIPSELRAHGATQAITKNDSYEKTLDLLWDSAKDVLKFSTSLNRVNKEVKDGKRPPTKREALSAVMSIYDPLGLLSCYTITAKSELQNLWRQKLGWDERIPTASAEVFAEWLRSLEHISHIELQRSYNGGAQYGIANCMCSATQAKMPTQRPLIGG